MKSIPCPYCGGRLHLSTRAHGPYYRCNGYPACDARVGAHRGDNAPLGTPATAPLRAARVAVHAAFDPIWRRRRTGRNGAREIAYRALAAVMGLRPDDCHVGRFDEAQCALAMTVLTDGSMLTEFTARLRATEEG